jgi:DNA segregation ATPase FtsK/SpoIIIE, S-DNA-T family
VTSLRDDPVRARAIERARADNDVADLLEAAELVIRSANGSWLMLHRKMRLAQGAAQRMLVRLEEHGVVDPEVAGQRRVRVRSADLEACLRRLREETSRDPASSPASSRAADAREAGDPDVADVDAEGVGEVDVDDHDANSAAAGVEGGADDDAGSGDGHASADASGDASVPADEEAPTHAPTSRPGNAPDDDPSDDAGEDTSDDMAGDRVPAVPVGRDLEPRGAREVERRAAGEVAEVGEEQPAQPLPPLLNAVLRSGAYVITTVRSDTPVMRTVRRTARTGYVTGQGITSWLKRATNASNHGHAREQLRMARLSGDPEAVADWLKIVDKLRNNRVHRLQRLPAALAALAIASTVLVVGIFVLAFVVGVLAWLVWAGEGWHYWWWLARLISQVFAGAIVVASALALVLAVPVTFAGAYREGQRSADPPRWLLSMDERRGLDAFITPTRIAIALRDCGLSELRKYIKESPDGGGELIGTITPAGRGVEVDVRPPTFVSTDQLIAKKRRIAEALDRHHYELYMSIVAARTLRFWIADPGALDEPLGASPLVTMGTQTLKVNLEKDRCPWGENLRGDLVGVHLWQRHLTIAGLSNHGKTDSARALLLWMAYDVHVEFRIADLKGYGDWDMFGPIDGQPGLATVYISGPTEQHAIDATLMLEEGVAEMKRRMASGRKDHPTLVLAVDEAQVAYMNTKVDGQRNPYGGSKNTSRFFIAARELHNQGRAVNVILHQYLQDPTDQNFPEMVREGAHIRISLVVGTPSKSRMALGEAAVEGGAAPHLLRRDIDKGVVVMHGGVEIPRGEAAITVRNYYIDDAAAWTLARGAIERRRKAGKTPLIIEGGAAAVVIDALSDMYQGMRGENRVKTTVVLSRMREENPTAYEEWSAQDFAAAVREYVHLGLDIRRYGGDSVLRIEEVERALRERK